MSADSAARGRNVARNLGRTPATHPSKYALMEAIYLAAVGIAMTGWLLFIAWIATHAI
jgi:hypothetical protein